MEEARLRHRLAALLPRPVWPLVAGRAEGRRTEGCVLFADLAGFTALTERLSAIGREGAEELTRIVNRFFEAQITVVHRAGGDVLRFGGDALTVFFEKGARPALEAALAMQAAAGAFHEVPTRAGTFSLAMKIGAAEGSVLLGLVGDEERGRDYFAAGRALDDAAEAEHRAARGEVVLSPALAGRARSLGFGLAEAGDGFARLEGGAGPPPAPEATLSPEPPPLLALESFLPPWAVEKARLNEGLWAAEHRRTTVLFLSYSGLDYENDPRVLDKVRAVYGEIAREVQRHGGWVNKVDMGDKGSKAIALFGVPRALEGAEEAACRAALRILESGVLRELLPVVRIGIASAPLFAGYVGCEERREFTVMGDGINLSARLMANAHAWRVLCDGATREKAEGRLAFRTLDPIFVKGKREKVPIHRPEGEREEAEEAARAFVGREALLDALLQNLTGAEGPPVLAVTGPPGAGKSALLHRLGLRLEERGIRHSTVPLAPHSAHGYLSAFRPVLFSALGVSRSAPGPIQEAALRAALLPEDHPYLPLFGPVLSFAFPETPETAALSPKDRKDILFAMAQRILEGLAAGGRYILSLDGLEWADAASLEFLEAWAPQLLGRGLRLVLSFREGAAPRTAALVPEGAHFKVEPFSAKEIGEFLVRAAGAAPPPEAFVAFLLRKSGGNPKFLEQILRVLEEQGLFRPGPSGLLEVDEDRLAAARFPDTLEGILLSRADGLPEGERRLLKTAAVLGTSFSLNLLARLSGEGPEAAAEGVRSLERKGFVRMDSWGQRPYAIFADPLLRDALYESLTFEARRGLHRQAARFLEAESGTDRRVWPALARHYEAASEAEPALRYLGLCAEEARARYDNTAAFDFLSRLVALKEASGARAGDDPAYRRALLHLAESAKELGRLEEAEALSRKILESVSEACEETVVSLMRLADIERRRGNLDRSLELDEEALARSAPLAEPVLESRILLDSGVSHAMAGRFGEALSRFKEAAHLARKAGTPTWQVLALMNQGLCQQYGSADLESARATLGKALRLARRYALRPQMVNLAINLAQVLADMGKFGRALALVEEPLSISTQFGYRTMSAFLISNRALYRTMTGQWDWAAQDAERGYQLCRTHGMGFSEAATLHTRGILLAVEGAWKESVDCQVKALEKYSLLKSEQGVRGAVSELLMVENALGLKSGQLGWQATSGVDPRALSEVPGQHGLAIRAQLLLRQRRSGEASLAVAWQNMEEILQEAYRAKVQWLVAEVGELLLRLLLEAGNVEEASVAGLAVYPKVVPQKSPLKTGAFLLTFGECLLATQRWQALGGVLRRLQAYGKAFDRGLLGLRYRLLRAEVSAGEGRLPSARYHARAARRIADAVEALQRDSLFLEAYRRLPEMARLMALEARLGL
ncbi:MAG: AAA family ATPase [Acidobacteriota bacterium]